MSTPVRFEQIAGADDLRRRNVPHGMVARVERPELVINPRFDDAFVRRVLEIAAEANVTPDDLATRLRTTYRNVVVRRRSLSGEAQDTWYVYREGTWIPSAGGVPRPAAAPRAGIPSRLPVARRPTG